MFRPQIVLVGILCLCCAIFVSCGRQQEMLDQVVGDRMDYRYEEEEYYEEYTEYDSDPQLASILSISDNRPAEVTIGWMTSVADGCSGAKGVSAKRDGNNIYLAIKKSKSTGSSFACTLAVEDIYGAFTVKNLEVGEYIIRGHHQKKELGRFRIEPDTAYSTITTGPRFRIDDEEKEDTYHVTAVLPLYGYRKIGCEPIVKTDIERTQDTINIAAWEVIPKTDCQIIQDTFLIPEAEAIPIADRYESFPIDIDLGTFSTGSYTVIINGSE